MKHKNYTKGFILKKNFYKDTSVFLEIFTLKFWKRTFFIKNFKKSKKINSAFLNIWSEIEINFSERWDIRNIVEVSFIDGFENLDEEGLTYLSYFLWLAWKFLHENEESDKTGLDIYLFFKKFFLVFKNFSEKEFIINEKKIFDEKNFLLLKIFFEVNFFTKLWYLKNLENNFLKFLQNNNLKNILNTKISETDSFKVFHIFDTFLLENNCDKIIKIFDKKNFFNKNI